MLTPRQIGTRLARKIFECGDQAKDKVQRLQMKGGTWPDNETDLGGYCEVALASYIATLLETDEDFR